MMKYTPLTRIEKYPITSAASAAAAAGSSSPVAAFAPQCVSASAAT
jgi:hypothetical protein